MIVALALMFTEQGFLEVAALVLIAHIPVMVIEGILTVFLVLFLEKMQPQLLPGREGQNRVLDLRFKKGDCHAGS